MTLEEKLEAQGYYTPPDKQQAANNPAPQIMIDGKPYRDLPDDYLLGMTQAALVFGKTHTTIARWCDEGLIAFVRFPGVGGFGRRAIRKSTVERFIGGTNIMQPRGPAETIRENS